MHIFDAAFPCGGIAQVSHVQFAGKRKLRVIIGFVYSVFPQRLPDLSMCRTEYLGDGIGTLGPFAEHVLLAGLRIEFDRGHSGTFLTTVVLFLHHQIELVQTIHPSAILMLIVA